MHTVAEDVTEAIPPETVGWQIKLVNNRIIIFLHPKKTFFKEF